MDSTYKMVKICTENDQKRFLMSEKWVYETLSCIQAWENIYERVTNIL